MARLFPNKPVGAVSPEAGKVWQALRRLPGEEFLVWIRLPFFPGWRPDFMVLNSHRTCHLFVVSSLTDSQAEATGQRDLFAATPGIEPSEFLQGERLKLLAFIDKVGAYAEADPCRAEAIIQPVIAFPNVSQDLLSGIARLGAITDCQLWGRESLRAEVLARRIQAAARRDSALSQRLVDRLRETFSPDISVPEHLVARTKEKPRRNVGAQLTRTLLDLDQEFLAKEDLTFSPEADAVVREMRLRLVTGVAGSGKSLILLYRVMLQARLRPESRILVLTHNRPLCGELRERFSRLCPDGNVEWTTFYHWCREFSGARWEIIKPWERDALIGGLVASDSRLGRVPHAFIGEEIDWIRDQGIFSREEYLAVARLGRKRPLQDDQRSAIFTLLVRYTRALKKRRQEDWAGAAARVWRQVETGSLQPPVYDSVFVDEAQFFAPTWLQIARRSVRRGTGQLFLAADPTQGFLKRRQSWKSSGLHVRNHSARLLRCYRNTREILGFACAFYRCRIPADDEEINLPVVSEIAALDSGEAPELVPVDSLQSERARVANEIVAAIRKGANPEHFLVLHCESALVEPFLQTLNRCFGRTLGRDLKDYQITSPGKVRVSSLNAATGLESPIVFLCGLDGLLEKEGALDLDSDGRSELIRDNTRRIYMAMTRASRKLFITYRRPATKALLRSTAGSIPPHGPRQDADTAENADTANSSSPRIADRLVYKAPPEDNGTAPFHKITLPEDNNAPQSALRTPVSE